jgi:hypothetical protein
MRLKKQDLEYALKRYGFRAFYEAPDCGLPLINYGIDSLILNSNDKSWSLYDVSSDKKYDFLFS